jgi:hypothetical protein
MVQCIADAETTASLQVHIEELSTQFFARSLSDSAIIFDSGYTLPLAIEADTRSETLDNCLHGHLPPQESIAQEEALGLT